jgi:hypothetical protein
MPEHKFRVGQIVDFFPGRGVDRGSEGSFTIVRLLPIEANTLQYQIRNNVDGQERRDNENEIGAH